MIQQEQRYNWNEHRYDDSLKVGILIAAATTIIYSVFLIAYIFGPTPNLNVISLILLSYPLVTWVAEPLCYYYIKRQSLWRFLGGAFLGTFISLLGIGVIATFVFLYAFFMSLPLSDQAIRLIVSLL